MKKPIDAVKATNTNADHSEKNAVKKTTSKANAAKTETAHSEENAVKKPAKHSKTAKSTSTTSGENAMKKPAKRSKTPKSTSTTSEENAMKKPANGSKTATVVAAEDATIDSPTVASTSTIAPSAPLIHPSIANPAAAAPAVAPATIALTYLAPPPADALIPTPPSGAATPNGSNYRSLVPKAIELAALPGAVADLQRFGTFASVFSVGGLAYAQVLQAFAVASQWSTMRKATSIWDAYSQSQEGIAWGNVRPLMDRMGPLFEIATTGDPTLTSTFPSLATLLGAKKTIGQKAAGIRKLNKEAVARGEPPTHGAVGKRREKAALKALAASTKAAPAAAPTAATSSGSGTTSTSPGTGTSGSGH